MKPTPWAETHKKQFKEKRKELKQAGRKPAGLQHIYWLRPTVIAIPPWAYEQALPELESTAEYIWLKGAQLAKMLAKLDQEEGGSPELEEIEARRCRICGMLRLGLLAEQRGKLDESAFDGRKFVCGDECMTRRKQQKGKL